MLEASLLSAEKGISSGRWSFPPALMSYLLKQRKPRCYRKREDSWSTVPFAGIWGFCIQNHPLPTKNMERKQSQGICSRMLVWTRKQQTALLRWNFFGKRMTKSGYSHPEFQGHWCLCLGSSQQPRMPAGFIHEVFPRHPFAWLQFSHSFWKSMEAGKAPGRV